MRDDRIRIFSQGLLGVPVLRHSAQKSVCCLSWRPHAGRELAVACYSGVLIWTIELGAASNLLSHAVLLKQRKKFNCGSLSRLIVFSCFSFNFKIIRLDHYLKRILRTNNRLVYLPALNLRANK